LGYLLTDMPSEDTTTPTVVPNIIHIMDIGAFIETLRDELPEMAHFTVTFNKGEPTVAFSIPNSISEDFNSKFAKAGELVYALLEQVTRHGTYKSIECEDEGEHKKWDVNTA